MSGIAVALLIALPAVPWALAVPLAARFAEPSFALRSLSVLAALCGAAALAVTVVLGARLPHADALFGGVDRLYATHRATGLAALGLLTAHGALLLVSAALRSVDAVLALFGTWQVIVGTVAFVGVTAGTLLALRATVRHEPFVWIMRALGLAYLVASIHVFAMSGTKALSVPLALYLGVLTAAGIAAFLYRSVLSDRAVPRHEHDVAAVDRLDASVMEVSLAPRGAPLRFEPGQFVYVAFRQAGLRREFHPFSITSARGEGRLRIVVKALGDHTAALLRELRPGASATVEGPYRGPYTRVEARRQVWIAGGIGITPFLSLARSLDDAAREIDLYYCVERRDQTYFLDELYAIADANPPFRVVTVRKDDLGFLTADDVAAATRNVAGKDILVSGPPAMLENLARQFRRAGVPAAQIHYERFRFR